MGSQRKTQQKPSYNALLRTELQLTFAHFLAIFKHRSRVYAMYWSTNVVKIEKKNILPFLFLHVTSVMRSAAS